MFTGFTAADFDAYAPKKWKSNVFNRERLEVKQKLDGLGRAVMAAGGLTGADGALLAVDLSVEHPALHNHKQVEAQHLFFFRNEGARKELDLIIDRGKSLAAQIDDPTPQRNHVFLAVTINHEGLEVAVRLHPDARIDRENLERKLEDHFEREKLLGLVLDLGDGFAAGVGNERVPIGALDESRLLEVVASLAAPASAPALPGAPPRLLMIGRAFDRQTATDASTGLVDQVRDGLSKLLEIYRFIAWSRDNDFVLMREALQKEKREKRQRGLAKNDPVRIVRGMFAGKTGVVQEVDQKGGVRVLVGKVAVKLGAEDVAKA